MTINNKSERNYRGKCLGSPVTSYGGVSVVVLNLIIAFELQIVTEYVYSVGCFSFLYCGVL